jgi:proteasome lid subunit RPN8/RPN11
MGIPFESGTWSLTSWSECGFPPWLNKQLVQQGDFVAENAFPSEVSGFFVRENARIRLHTFAGLSGSSWCSASPEEVIQFAYRVADGVESEAFTVLASFHTHPVGGTSPSVRDEMFTMWAKTHLFWIKEGPSWNHRIFLS